MIERPVALVGQSMGGYVAAACRRGRARPGDAPRVRRHLGGGGHGGARCDGLAARRPPVAPRRPAVGLRRSAGPLGLLAQLTVPVLLLWASRDAISPLAVGERLQHLLGGSELVVYDSDDHWVVRDHAVDVASRIRRLVGSP